LSADSFLLNLPPDRHGYMPAEDARSAREFNELLLRTFARNLAADAVATASNVRGASPRHAAGNAVSGMRDAFWATDHNVGTSDLLLEFGKPVTFNLVSLDEYLPAGTRSGGL
jgi:alpha-L-fucosidase